MNGMRLKGEQQVYLPGSPNFDILLRPIKGKQMVYHILQECLTLSPGDLERTEETIRNLREEVVAARAIERSIKIELSGLEPIASTDGIQAAIEGLLTRKARIIARSEELKKVDAKPFSEEQKRAAEELRKLWKKHADNRKRIVKELWLKCLDTRLDEAGSNFELWVSVGFQAEKGNELTSMIRRNWAVRGVFLEN